MLLRYVWVSLAVCFVLCAGEKKSSESKEETTAGDPFHLRTTIVVTATRDEQDLKQSPAATSVVTQKEIEARNAQTIDQSLNVIPGMYVLRTKGPADTLSRVNVRGFNGANRSLVLLDGQPINDAYNGEVNWTTLPIGEVDRVEVVRGAYSSLYGGEALGGVINILTRPVTKRELTLTGQHGTYNTSNYSVRFTDRLFDRLGLSFGYQRLQTGGYESRTATTSALSGSTGTWVTGVVPLLTTTGTPTYGIGRSGANWYNQHAYRVTGDYAFSSTTTVSLQYLRQQYGYGYDAYQSFLQDPSGNVVDNGNFLFTDGGIIKRISVTPSTFLQGPGDGYSHFISGSLQHSFSARQFLRVDAGYFNLPSDGYRSPGRTATLGGGPGTNNDRTSRTYHANLQHHWQTGRHAVTFGAETRHSMANSNVFATPDWTISGGKAAQNSYMIGRSINQSGYAQDQIRLGESFHVIAGVRYDYWKTYEGQFQNFVNSDSATFSGRSRNAFSGKLAAVYRTPGDWIIRASVGSAFRNPTVYELYNTTRIVNILYVANPNLKPERLKSWETGVRKTFGEAFDLDLTYYENYIDDLIYRQTITPQERMNVNAGAGRTRGVEWSGRHRLASWLSFREAYTYTNALITQNPAVPQSEGKQTPYIPSHLISGQLLGAGKRWIGSVTARYVGKIYTQDTNSDTTKGVPGAYDPFFTADASLSYQLSRRLDVFGSSENLLDRRFYAFFLSPGRTVNIGLRIKL